MTDWRGEVQIFRSCSALHEHNTKFRKNVVESTDLAHFSTSMAQLAAAMFVDDQSTKLLYKKEGSSDLSSVCTHSYGGLGVVSMPYTVAFSIKDLDKIVSTEKLFSGKTVEYVEFPCKTDSNGNIDVTLCLNDKDKNAQVKFKGDATLQDLPISTSLYHTTYRMPCSLSTEISEEKDVKLRLKGVDLISASFDKEATGMADTYTNAHFDKTLSKLTGAADRKFATKSHGFVEVEVIDGTEALKITKSELLESGLANHEKLDLRCSQFESGGYILGFVDESGLQDNIPEKTEKLLDQKDWYKNLSRDEKQTIGNIAKYDISGAVAIMLEALLARLLANRKALKEQTVKPATAFRSAKKYFKKTLVY